MRVLVTGAKGQLGSDIILELKNEGIKYTGLDINKLDLTDFQSTREVFMEYMPDVVIHSAAFTDVEKAEMEVEKCRRINVDATGNIAMLCNSINAKLVYISTDYVFSGDSAEPYEIDSEPGPLSVYGRSKLDGEFEVMKKTDKFFIIRTSWAYGVSGKNFVSTMLRIGKKQESVDVVSDQVGSPTYTADLSKLIVSMIKTEKYGVYHATNEGFCSWAEFAVEIFRLANLSTKVNFITTDMYPVNVIRPKNSTMSKKVLDINGFVRLPHWMISLESYMKKIAYEFDDK
ncbi:dTDP-4-dehydrorhamnose reductase [Paenibacillus sp. FSL P4-0081]|jgi:dTDP-4-dehydrorhamnose reductase|uniref:dTDP-4-dehydrorhamnose reductase n=1 Tax=Paenibacillus sp. FSL P4-0081 TaxID=1536769 RepID=UPI0004F8C57C|nr:dTDP-4-dehydrorhamnose reductase [Paenibacillus sp. FSL P4-0081]AIQ32640.1 dTDP-4-dehydrorhamnose reductase [Paenibacillus sp. FSL P4-0081]